jgi:hypothetical protein
MREVAESLGLLFPTVIVMYLFLSKKRLGNILGDFFSRTHLVSLRRTNVKKDDFPCYLN